MKLFARWLIFLSVVSLESNHEKVPKEEYRKNLIRSIFGGPATRGVLEYFVLRLEDKQVNNKLIAILDILLLLRKNIPRHFPLEKMITFFKDMIINSRLENKGA